MCLGGPALLAVLAVAAGVFVTLARRFRLAARRSVLMVLVPDAGG